MTYHTTTWPYLPGTFLTSGESFKMMKFLLKTFQIMCRIQESGVPLLLLIMSVSVMNGQWAKNINHFRNSEFRHSY